MLFALGPFMPRVFEPVHAFEPNPMLWPQFERNMMLNGLTNVCLHKLGLADRASELTLHLIDKPNYGLGTVSTVEQYDLPLRPAATCAVRHAGNYFENNYVLVRHDSELLRLGMNMNCDQSNAVTLSDGA